MAWEKKDVTSVLPDEFSDLATTAETLSSNLTAIVDVLKAAVLVAKVFVTTNVDPFSTLAQAIIGEIEELINDFFASGFSMLVITPNDIENGSFDSFGVPTMTPDRALKEAIASFDDVGDARRPQFSDSASVTGFALLVTAPNIDDLVTKLEGLKSVLNLKGLDVYLKQAKRAQTQPTRASKMPDWKTTKLADIPGFSDLHKSLKGYLNQFKGYLVTGDAFLDDFIKALENKVNAITKAVDELNESIDKIVGGIGASGAYWLDIPEATGGNTYLKAQIPDSDLSALTVNNYTAMVLFVAGGASTAGLENFKSVFS